MNLLGRPRTPRTDPQTCRKCGELLPLIAFPKYKGEPGLTCASCRPKPPSSGASTSTKQKNGQVRFVCEECDTEFYRYPNGKRGRYCSKVCSRKNHVGGSHPTTRTDPMQCHKCGETKALSEYTLNSKGLHNLRCAPCMQSTSEQKRRSHLRLKFKMTLEEWISMYEAQRGECPVCDKKLPALTELLEVKSRKTGWNNRDWNTDHDHKTGKVRAITCRLCNVGLGSFKDSIQVLQKAIEYLRKHNTIE